MDTVWLPVLPSMKGFGPALIKGAGAEAEKAGDAIGGRFGKAVALGATAAVGAVTAVGGVLYKVGSVFDEVSDTIRAKTGASGAALEELNDVAKRVGATVPAEFEKIGPVVAAVSQRLGLTGDQLQKVSSQYLEAGRVLGQEIDVDKTSAAFSAFQIKGENVSGALDHLFRVSQSTGVGMNELASSVSQNAPALQTLGFGFEEAAAMVGSFDKAGLNSGQIMASMSKGLVTLAKDGEKPAEAYRRVVGEISGFIAKGDEASALNLASEVFGTRGATQFIGAIKSGSMSLEEMAKIGQGTGDTILGVGEDTADFAEQWQMFKNKVLVWLEPLASTVFGGLGTAMGEMTAGVTAFGAAWAANDGDITSSGLPGFMEALAFQLRQAFDFIQNTALPAVQSFGGRLGGTFGPALERVGGFVRDTLVPALQGFGGYIISDLLPALQNIGSFILTDVIPALGQMLMWLLDNGETVKNVGLIIGVILLPALVRLGVGALVSAGKQVTAWAMSQAGAVKTGVVYVAQSIIIIGRWVAMGAAALVSGAQTVYVWGLYAAEAIKGALAFAVSVARVVGGWVLMGVQSMIHAARMAAAWLIALGPIGWITAAVIGIVALIIANWETISRVTTEIWGHVVSFFTDVWNNIVAGATWLYEQGIKPVFDKIGEIVMWIWNNIVSPYFNFWIDLFTKIIPNALIWLYENGIRPAFDSIAGVVTWIWNTIISPYFNFWIDLFTKTIPAAVTWLYENGIKPAFDKIGGTITWVWDHVIKPTFDALSNFVTKTIPAAFESGVGFIRTAWEKLQEIAKAPVKFVVETVINDGLINGLNNIGGFLGLPKIPRVALPPGFMNGGYTGDGPRHQVKGAVHAGEFVFTKEQTAILGKERLAAMAHAAVRGEAYAGAPMPGSLPFIQGPLQSAIRRTRQMRLTPVGSYPMSDLMTAARAWNGRAGVTVFPSPMARGIHDAAPNQVYVGHGPMPPGAIGYYQDQSITMGRHNPLQIETIIHEVGHALGIHHNTGNASIMHPMLRGGGATWPTPYDTANLQRLYGPPGAGARPIEGDPGTGWNPIKDIIDGLLAKFREMFKDAGFIADIAIGVGKKLLDGAVDFVTGGGKQQGPALYDLGGVLPPGVSQVVNRTRKPEAILNPQQWADIHRLALRDGMRDRPPINIETVHVRDENELARVLRNSERDAQAVYGY